MGQFWKFTFASLLGVILALILGIFVMIGFVAVIISSGQEEAIVVENSILRMKLDYQIYDRVTNAPPSMFTMADFGLNPKPGLDDILKAIEKAAMDPNIKGI